MNENIGKAIFGGFDGVVCILGVIAAGVISGDIRTLLLAAVALALAESVAMSGGSYLSEVTTVASAQHALIVGTSAGAGILIPVIPFFFLAKNSAVLVSLLLIVFLAIIIAQVRAKTIHWAMAYVQTFSIIIIAATVSILATLLLNSVGI